MLAFHHYNQYLTESTYKGKRCIWAHKDGGSSPWLRELTAFRLLVCVCGGEQHILAEHVVNQGWSPHGENLKKEEKKGAKVWLSL
jgi:hypothetical protein